MSGLQCWDAKGTLIVDLGDYMTRYHGKATITIAKGAASGSVAFSGATQAGTFAAITAANPRGGFNECIVRATNGKLTAYYLPTGNALYAFTLTVEVYSFI